MNTYNFAIISKEDETVALKHITITADSPEVAEDFAKQELDAFRATLELKSEEFN
jgi:hypothetical protein